MVTSSSGETWMSSYAGTYTYVPATLQSPHARYIYRYYCALTRIQADGTGKSAVFEHLLPRGLALAPDGGVYLVGAESTQEVLVRIAPDGSIRSRQALGDVANAVAVGPDGAIYIAGQTRCSTPSCADAVVLKFRPEGDRVYRRTFGGLGSDTALTVAIDSTGAAVVAGRTESWDFPVGPGAAQFARGESNSMRGFAVRLDPAGESLTYATYLGGAGKSDVMRVAVDAAGSAYFVGSTAASDFSASAGAFQMQPGGGQDGFLIKLDRQGAPLFATYIGGPGDDAAQSLALDGSRLYVAVSGPLAARLTGRTPTPCDAPFVLFAFDSGSGAALDRYAPRPISASHSISSGALAVDGRGILHVAGRNSTSGSSTRPMGLTPGYLYAAGDTFLMRIDWSAREGAAPACLLAAAGLVDNGMVLAPGEIATIFGRGIGPVTAVAAQPDASGRYPRMLGGVRVLLDHVALPLLYVSDSQINFVVPYSTGTSAPAQLSLEYEGDVSGWRVYIRAGIPQIFSSESGDAIVLNEDGSLNSAERPAAKESVIRFFASGLGALDAPWPDDMASPEAEPWPSPRMSTNVAIGAQSARVLYSGLSPGAPPGVYRIDIRIPKASAGPAVLWLRLYDAETRVAYFPGRAPYRTIYVAR